MVEKNQVEYESQKVGHHQKSPGWGNMVIENIPMLVMFILGAVIFSYLGWAYGLGYLAYCVFSLIWFMRFICVYCGNAYGKKCYSGMGAIALKLFKRKSAQRFREQFKKHIGIVYPCWFLPPITALYFLIKSFTYQMLILLILFSVVAFVILPFMATKKTCEDCVMKDQCTWKKRVNKAVKFE